MSAPAIFLRRLAFSLVAVYDDGLPEESPKDEQKEKKDMDSDEILE